jgi:hypothetical protein
MEKRAHAAQITLALFAGIAVLTVGQAAQRNQTLVVSGYHGELAVVDVGGHPYVEIEGLARLINGSVTFHKSQIVLTLPGTAPSPPAEEPVAGSPGRSGFSDEFMRAGIEEMAVIREWRSTLTNAIQRGFPVTEDWVGNYRAQAQQSLRLASLAISTDSDREAFKLLTNEYDNMNKLSIQFLKANQSRSYVSPDSLENHPLDKRILDCAHSLAAMAASGHFFDDGSCH